jgi:hypothetical protein
MIFRQGDVILKKIDDTKAPISQKEASFLEEIKGETIVAHGEATGHHHKFTSGQVMLFTRPHNQPQGPAVVTIESDYATLTHQEHLPIQLPKGTYSIIREITYDPFHTLPTNVTFSISNHLQSHIQSYIQSHTRTVSD